MKKFLIVVLLLLCVNTVLAKNSWVVQTRYENVSPVHISYGYSSNYLIIFENGDWYHTSELYIKDSVRSIRMNTVGSMYMLVDEDGNWQKKNKWVEHKKLTLKRKESQKTKEDLLNAFLTKKMINQPITAPTQSPVKKRLVTKNINWIKADRKMPPKDTVVLVKYKNGLLTTAYLNNDNEWKLNTDRDNLFEGDVITVIEKWRIIQ